MSDLVQTGGGSSGDSDTIVAISTPPGRGGIGVVRVSGPMAVEVAGRVVRLVGGGELGDAGFHARARLAGVVDWAGEGVIDEAMVTVFHAPKSYTGEMLVEMAAHGSPVVLEAMVRGALEAGSRKQEVGSRGQWGALEAGSRKQEVGSRGQEVGSRGQWGAEPEQGLRRRGKRQIPGENEKEGMASFGNDMAEVVLEENDQKNVDPKGLRGVVRLAEPGEFTQRAFLAGKLDLTQAEAVHDLIAAQTLDQARVAAQQMGGALSRRVGPAKERLLHLIAVLEAGMDFASGELDDVDVVAPGEIAEAIAAVRGPLEALAGSFRRGQLMREGAAIALVGRPNVGKSSLFNRLLERERSIVTAVAGTTRDTVEEQVSLGGVPVRLIDTAGMRKGISHPNKQRPLAGDRGREQGLGSRKADFVGGLEIDEAERLGMVRSEEALADADVVVVVQDASVEASGEERAMVEGLAGRPHVVVRNKVDLVGERDGAGVWTSAVTGEGLEELRAAILGALGMDGGVAAGGALNTLRQQEAVRAALGALEAAEAANCSGMPHEVVLMDLHGALGAVDSLTGVTTADDILARIFAAFCIGK